MPNWCANAVTIKGTEEKIAEIKKVVTDYHAEYYDKSGNNPTVKGLLAYCISEPDYDVVPVKETYPKDGEANKATIRKNSWWDWRVQNWGTKWEVAAHIVDDSEKEIVLRFDSAWAPPLEAYSELLKREGITSILAFYYEQAMDFAGKYKDGELEQIQISNLTHADFKHDDTVRELDWEFNVYDDIMSSNPVQIRPEYEPILKGLGMDDFWDIDHEDVELIYQTLKGKDILEGAIELIYREQATDKNWPTHFTFDNKEYSL